MEYREGERVMVNLAPFIGAQRRSKQSVPCVVKAVRADKVQVTPVHPYRSVTLWVAPRWIETARPSCLEAELITS